MSDLRGQQLKDSYQDVVTRGTGNKLENGNGVEFIDLDDKASLSGNTVQVHNVMKTDTYSESVDPRPSTTSDIPGLSVTISPKFSDSKMIINAHIVVSGNARIGFQIYRDGSQVALPDSFGNRQAVVSNTQLPAPDRGGPLSGLIEDFPETTNEITYTLRLTHLSGDGIEIFVNRGEDDGNSDGRYRGISTLTVTEVAP